jgi:hypothetical protein
MSRAEGPRPYTETSVSLALFFPPGRASETPVSNEINNRPRINTGLAPSESMYTGAFYVQGKEETCMPWAIANAMTILDVAPQPAFMKNILNHAIGLNSNSEEGLARGIAHILINRFPGIQVKAERLGGIMTPEEEQIMAEWFEDTYQEKSFETIVKNNAAHIKDALDKKIALIASIKQNGSDSTHAICISGYRVSSDGCMDLQIVDSNFVTSYKKNIEKFSRELTLGGMTKLESIKT